MPNRKSSRTLSRARVFALLLLACLWSAVARAQMCGDTYLGQNSPTDLIQVDTSTNPFGTIVLGTADTRYNAMAYRPADNTLYAIQVDGPADLLSINLDGSVNNLGSVGLPGSCCNVGAFAPDGFMYVKSSDASTLWRIDIDALAATSISLSSAMNASDIAWFDGLFYGVNNNNGNLMSLDPSTGTVSAVGPGGGVGGSFGAMFSASNGVFGVRNNGAGAFQFDVTTGAGTKISDAPGSSNNDAARCLEAVLEFEVDLSVTKDDGSDTYTPGTDVIYDIVVVNSGPFGVQNAEVSDPLPDGITTASWTCEGANGGVCGADSGSGAIVDTVNLPPGASVTYTLTLTVPKEHAGDLINTVTVELPDGFIDPTPGDNSATDVDKSTAEPSITLEKTGEGPDPLTVGATVEYTFVVTNTGNTTLSNITVTDPLPGMSPIDCPGDTLAPDEDMTCTSTYTVTQEDADAGVIENTATVTGQSPQGDSVTDEDVAIVPPSQKPGISIEKSGSGPDPLEVGATIDYTFLVTNTGNVTLSDVTVTDPLPGLSPIACPDDTLAPGAEMTCTATYTVTQEDVDAGQIENTATVTGTPPGGLPPPTDEGTTTFPPDQNSGISIEKSGSGPDPLTVGATIDYEFLVTNTGNVTLTNVVVTDPLPGLSPIECPGTTLAPGAEMTCTATYEVTQADAEAGVVENTATVTGETPTGGPPPTDESTTTVPPISPVPSLPSLAFILLVALLATSALWTLRRARA